MPINDFLRYGPKFGEECSTPLDLMRKLDSKEPGWRGVSTKYALLIFKQFKDSDTILQGLMEYCEERSIGLTWYPNRREFCFETYLYEYRIFFVADDVNRCLGLRTDYFCYIY
jgi:hypothetical protein